MASVTPLLLARSASAANTRTFHDPFGDLTCCTRDLTDIRVSNSDAGTITFHAAFDDRYEGNDDDDLDLLLDTPPRSAATRFIASRGLSLADARAAPGTCR